MLLISSDLKIENTIYMKLGHVLNAVFTGTLIDWIWVAVIVSIIFLVLIIAFFVLTSKKHGSKQFTEISELQASQKIEDGFVGVDMGPAQVVGQTGVALTDLRPSGKITVAGVDYDAVALLDFIASGSEIIVEKYENAQLYVKEKK